MRKNNRPSRQTQERLFLFCVAGTEGKAQSEERGAKTKNSDKQVYRKHPLRPPFKDSRFRGKIGDIDATSESGGECTVHRFDTRMRYYIRLSNSFLPNGKSPAPSGEQPFLTTQLLKEFTGGETIQPRQCADRTC